MQYLNFSPTTASVINLLTNPYSKYKMDLSHRWKGQHVPQSC